MFSQFTSKQRACSLLTLLISVTPILPLPAVAQQACVMTKAGKKVCGTLILLGTPNNSVVVSPRSAGVTDAKSSGSAVILDYPNDVKVSIQVAKCREYGSDILCTLNVTKIQGENDNEAGFVASFEGSGSSGAKSEAIDDKDRSYVAIKVASRRGGSAQGIIVNLSKNQTTPITLSFKIPDDVKTLKKLTFPVAYGKGDAKVATFSNINISR